MIDGADDVVVVVVVVVTQKHDRILINLHYIFARMALTSPNRRFSLNVNHYRVYRAHLFAVQSHFLCTLFVVGGDSGGDGGG